MQYFDNVSLRYKQKSQLLSFKDSMTRNLEVTDQSLDHSLDLFNHLQLFESGSKLDELQKSLETRVGMLKEYNERGIAILRLSLEK